MLSVNLRDAIIVKNVTVSYKSLILETTRGNIKLEPYNDKIVRIVYTVKECFSEDKSLGVISKPNACKWSFEENESFVTLITASIKIKICKNTCAISYYDTDDSLLVKEPENGGKYLEEFELYKTVIDENTTTKKIQTPDGVKEIVESDKKVFDKISYHTKLEFKWADDEALYGLGQQEDGIMNLRGTCQYIHQANMKIAMPFILSTKGYGILVDTYSTSIFHDDQHGSYLWTYADDEMDFYFIYGPSFDNIVKEYRFLTGKTPMLPKWSFGFIQSQERYETQQEIIDVVKEYRRRNIPLDGIVLDWQYWGENLWGEKSFDLSRFPDAKAMIGELHSLGAQLMISVWPDMRGKTDNYREMKENGFLLNGIAIYNPFKREARELYWKQANLGLFSKGIDAWWCDSSEPFVPEWRGEVCPGPDRMFNMFTETASKFLDAEYINAFPLMHAQGIYDGQRSVTSEKRVINLTRSSYIGQQRYGTIMWSGDISASWDTLKKQIPAGLNFCVTGFPYWTLDIGAFFVKKGKSWMWNGDYNDGNNDMGYRELVVRWFQFGAFLPIFRSHGTDTRREIWEFGDEGDLFYDVIKKFINLRYSLMPYIYSLAGMVTQNDYTILRALAFDFQNDKNVYNIKDQYMFGNALMICPVTNPMYYGKNSLELKDVSKSRTVYLPNGYKWYDFWTNAIYNGGDTITASADIDTMPIFVKAGSILPIGPKVQYTREETSEPMKIYIYTGADGEFNLYEDNGDNYDYENGDFSTIKLTWNNKDGVFSLEQQNSYCNNIGASKSIEIYIIENSQVKLVKEMEYDGSNIALEIL